MEKPRIRDFIETTDGLIFSVVSYHHPDGRCLAFLRYYKDADGERKRGGERYSKISSTAMSYDFLEKKFTDYVFSYEGSKLQGVPLQKIKNVHRPEERLKKICDGPKSSLEKKIKDLAEVFDDIPNNHKGITGSVLVGLDMPSSDIDFVIYGISNHERAREVFKNFAGDKIKNLSRKHWQSSYKKRFSGNKTLRFEEYQWHEKRKWHKGTIDGTIFDILLVRSRSEVGPAPKEYVRKEKVKVDCTVTDATLAFDSPAVYKVECKESQVREVLSYTHTYAGQAFKGEKIEACGFFEEALDGSYRVVVGTTREAPGEYIKVKI